MNTRRQTNTFSGGLNILNRNNISKACNCSGVYMIKNTLNEKKYIGSSINIKRRLYDHFHKLTKNTHHNKHLQAAWNKYGEKHFAFQVLETCEPIKDTILFLEQKYLDLKPEYNNAPIAGSNFGCKQSKESRLKRSLSCKGIINTRSIKWKDYASCDVQPAHIKISEYIKSMRKPVIKYSLDGEYIEEYSSISDAARKNNVVRSGIRDCCNGKQLSAYGFLWKLKNNNYERITTG